MADGVVVQRVDPERTYLLRRDVLRPGMAVEEMSLFEGEGDVTAFGALLAPGGEVVGTASLRRAPAPAGLLESAGFEEATATWQLRGMATREGLRSLGIGASVLDACRRHVSEQGGGVLWCNARVPARRFYERGGFVGWGDEFERRGVTHVVMWRRIEPVEGTS